MATEAAMGKRRADAIRRIEARCEVFGGGKPLKLPKTQRYGSEMLLVYQLEAIADYLEAVEAPAPPSEYAAMSFEALKALAAKRGLDEAEKLRSKATIITLLEAADAAEKANT